MEMITARPDWRLHWIGARLGYLGQKKKSLPVRPLKCAILVQGLSGTLSGADPPPAKPKRLPRAASYSVCALPLNDGWT